MDDPLSLVLFLFLSLAVVAASRHAWCARLAYGLYRFVALETLAVLVALNAGRWFRDPLSIPQICSWSLFVIATALAAHGIYVLRAVGRASARIMEDTHVVVRSGAYRYIRHPLYSSLILFGWGVFLKGVDVFGAILAGAVTAFLVATARSEEGHNRARLGPAYAAYRERTKMFIPFVI